MTLPLFVGSHSNTPPNTDPNKTDLLYTDWRTEQNQTKGTQDPHSWGLKISRLQGPTSLLIMILFSDTIQLSIGLDSYTD